LLGLFHGSDQVAKKNSLVTVAATHENCNHNKENSDRRIIICLLIKQNVSCRIQVTEW
jgi:hypothetical protein